MFEQGKGDYPVHEGPEELQGKRNKKERVLTGLEGAFGSCGRRKQGTKRRNKEEVHEE